MTVARCTVAIAGAVFFGLGLFGWVDLTGVWTLREGGTVEDIAWGSLAGLIVPAGFLAQVSRPRAAALCLPLAGATGCAVASVTQARFLVPTSVALAAAMTLAAIARPLPRRGSPDVVLLALAVAATIPVLVWVSNLSGERSPMNNAHSSLDAVAAAAAGLVAIVAAALGAVAIAPSRRLAAWCAGSGLAYVGVASVVYPHDEVSAGRTWGALAIAWGVAFVGVAEARA